MSHLNKSNKVIGTYYYSNIIIYRLFEYLNNIHHDCVRI